MEEIILIVDDKPGNILALENILATSGRKMLSATSGKEALTYLLKEVVDLIILDVQMPDMNGFEVAKVLKTNNRTRNIPVIFATAESYEHSYVMKGYDEGAFDYLMKPLAPELVKAKVNVLLKLQQQKKQLIERNRSLLQSALLIENSADIIGIIDSDGWIIEQVNFAFTSILGYDIDEVVGKKMQIFFNNDFNPVNLFNDSGSEHFSFENEMVCKDGDIRWMHWKIKQVDGKWYVNIRDVTSAKKTDEHVYELNEQLHRNIQQLQIANKELESFSYSVSHDLRAPLRAINGFARIIEEDYMPMLDDEANRLLHNIQDNAIRLGVLIDALLEFSRLGRKEVETSEVDMRRLVELAVEECRQMYGGQAIISIGHLPPAKVDHILMKQVWLNLVSNALKYSAKKDQPIIEIGWKPEGNSGLYYVKDNGAGFDMKYADKLFGVFQRLHNPKQFEGTGVGLAIVQRIIAKHGGIIYAESFKDDGAVFYFTIPGKTGINDLI